MSGTCRAKVEKTRRAFARRGPGQTWTKEQAWQVGYVWAELTYEVGARPATISHELWPMALRITCSEICLCHRTRRFQSALTPSSTCYNVRHVSPRDTPQSWRGLRKLSLRIAIRRISLIDNIFLVINSIHFWIPTRLVSLFFEIHDNERDAKLVMIECAIEKEREKVVQRSNVISDQTLTHAQRVFSWVNVIWLFPKTLP